MFAFQVAIGNLWEWKASDWLAVRWMCSCYIVQLWLVSTVEFWRSQLRAVGSAVRFKQADEWIQLRWIICGGILLMIFQNVATYSYICTYGLNARPCIVWEGKMFIEYMIHTQEKLELFQQQLNRIQISVLHFQPFIFPNLCTSQLSYLLTTIHNIGWIELSDYWL